MASSASDNDIATQLEAIVPPVFSQVPFFLVSQHDRKTTNVLSNSPNPDSVKSRNREFEFYFVEPVFVHNVKIFLSGIYDGADFEWKWVGFDSREFSGVSSSTDNVVTIPARGLASGFSFKPPKTILSSPDILKVEIHGFDVRQAGEFVSFASQIDDIKNQALREIEEKTATLDKKNALVTALQATRGSIQQDINSLKSSVSREQNKNKKLEEERGNLNQQISDLKQSYSQTHSDLISAKSELEKSSIIRSQLAKNINDKKQKLMELNAEIDLFPSELSSFSRQGSKDSRAFLYLSVIPLVPIICIFLALMVGAAELTTVIDYTNSLNLSALIASRAPYVLVACSIVTACYYITRMLILEAVRISRQRLALTKISIIAKDVSTSIEHALSLTDAEIYDARLRLKMDMMRDHLKEYVTKDFQPSLPRSITPSSWVSSTPVTSDGAE